jgi:hypothetical protein
MDKWADNSIQFPRLIAELEAAGAFTPEVLTELRELMDLDTHDIMELVDRAQAQWDHIKAGL